MATITKSYFALPEVEITQGIPQDTDAVVIAIYKNELRQSRYVEEISKKIKKEDIFYLCKKANFDGDSGKLIYFLGRPTFILVGLGNREENDIFWNRENVRRASALGCTEARKLGAIKVTLCGFEDKIKEALEGAFLGLYHFKKYSKDESKNEIQKLFLISDRAEVKTIELTRIICEAQNFVRDIVNEPGNVINPSTLAEISSAIAREYGLFCEIFEVEEMKKLGMRGVLAVGQGSATPPKFVHIWYKPEKLKSKEKIAFVGKAITFDSGGLSLKTQQNMQHMKADKAGACAVLGAMKVIAYIRPDVEVHGIFAACENMPSGTAQRVDDIIKMMDGKTVEVVNTDAEGRLTLADVISFTSKLGASKIVDLATLTGACMVALGEFTAGVMGNSEKFKRLIFETGMEVGDKMWILPFDRDIEEKLKSPVADLKNAADSYGGAIIGGMFISKFVGEVADWCHIDIAGPAFINKKLGYYTVEGATGFGVRTLVELIRKIQSAKAEK